ncbi:MAG: helix-loop-helix domain-containing protein [Gammaproteobacteria bacterium]
MIYLNRKKLLLFKPLKTASTSLEIAFACNACEDDIVTPMSTMYELMRLDMGAQLPVNYASNAEIERRYRAKIKALSSLRKLVPGVKLDTLEKVVKPFYKTKRNRKFFNHIKPSEVAAIMGDDFLKDSFIVTMCRHPYEVLISRVYWERWKKHRESDFDLNAAIDSMLETKEPLNLDYYFYKNEFVPDFVIRYENLTEDIAALEKKFDLRLLENMPVAKGKIRKSNEPAESVLSERQKEICYEKNKPIFERFGYTP